MPQTRGFSNPKPHKSSWKNKAAKLRAVNDVLARKRRPEIGAEAIHRRTLDAELVIRFSDHNSVYAYLTLYRKEGTYCEQYDARNVQSLHEFVLWLLRRGHIVED